MKREYIKAIREGIKTSDLNGYKWTVTKDGLKWSYCDTEFTFVLNEAGNFLKVRDLSMNESIAMVSIGDDEWDDAATVEDAYRIATKATIQKANYIY